MGLYIIFIALVGGLIWIAKYIDEKELQKDIKDASDKQDWKKYKRLVKIKQQRESNTQQNQAQSGSNDTFLAGLFVLMAAEDGFFEPAGEEVINRADRAFTDDNFDADYDDSVQYDDQDYGEDEYYDSRDYSYSDFCNEIDISYDAGSDITISDFY